MTLLFRGSHLDYLTPHASVIPSSRNLEDEVRWTWILISEGSPDIEVDRRNEDFPTFSGPTRILNEWPFDFRSFIIYSNSFNVGRSLP